MLLRNRSVALSRKQDSGGHITDIKEKNIVSAYVNAGVYSFANCNILRKGCEELLSQSSDAFGEYYISGAVKKLIKEGYNSLP